MMTWRRSFIHVLLAASIGANALLVGRLSNLQSTVSALTARPGLEIGTRLPALNLKNASGEPVRVKYGESGVPTILYVISPTCGWCQKNTASVTQLAHSVSSRAKVVAISIAPPPDKDNGSPGVATWKDLPFPVYTGLSDAQARELRVRSTPTTIVVAPEGKVLAVWEGAYTGKTKDAVQSYFALTLPELPQALPVQAASTARKP